MSTLTPTSSLLSHHTEPVSHPSLGMTLSHSSPKSNFSTPSWGRLQMIGCLTNKSSPLNCLLLASELKQSAIWKMLQDAKQPKQNMVQEYIQERNILISTIFFLFRIKILVELSKRHFGLKETI